MRWLIIFCLFAGVVQATNLVPCPDCEEMVSPRAVMCPHCGCPGEVIHEAVAQRLEEEEGPPPRPVVRVQSDHAQGLGVAVRFDATPYIVMDGSLLGASQSLRLTVIPSEESVSYRSLQIAPDSPLVRFETTAETLLFREAGSQEEGASFLWLTDQNQTLPVDPDQAIPEEAVAKIDADGKIVAVRAGSSRELFLPLPAEEGWIAVPPARYREQMNLLKQAETQLQTGPASSEVRQRVEATEWLSPYLKQTAQSYLESNPEN